MKRTILHVDFNSYFAAVEQQKNPFLRGKPVGIVKAEGRGVIIAASIEAKRRGVKTGTLVDEARALAPEIALVPADFDSYYDTTKRMVKICRRYSDRLELFSLDEVFMDLTGCRLGLGGRQEIALKIKRDLRKELGEWLTVSAGIAGNKLLAKLASDMEKPDGLVEITDKNRDFYLGKAKFNQICGIGLNLERRLRAIGVEQLLQIRLIPDRYLMASFGPFWSKELKMMAWGRDETPVPVLGKLPLPKSVSRTYTLYREIFDQRQILATIRNLVEEATGKLRRAGMAGRQFGLMVRGQGRNEAWFVTRKGYTNDSAAVFSELTRLWRRHDWRRKVRFLGVWISLLTEEGGLTLPLLPEVWRRERILRAQDEVNAKFGDYTLFPASLLRTKIVLPEVTAFLGDEPIRQRIRRARFG